MSSNHRTRKLMVALFSSLLVHSTVNAELSSKETWTLWRKAFKTYGKGEDLYLAENYKTALNKFKEAHVVFTKINKENPGWKVKLVTYRLGMCERKITKLSRLVSKSSSSSEAAGEAQPVSPETIASGQPKRELEIYKNKYFTVASELQISKREAERYKKSAGQLTTILREKKDLEIQVEVLERKVNKLKTADPVNNDGQFKDQSDTIAKLNIELTKFKEKLEKSTAQYAELEASSRLSQAEKERVNNRLTKLTSVNDNLSVQVGTLTKVKETQQNQFIFVQKENDRLKSELTAKADAEQALKSDFDALLKKSDLASATAILQNQKLQLEKAKITLEEKVSELEKKNNSLNSKFNQSISNTVNVGSEYNGLKKRFDTLTSVYNSMQKEHTDSTKQAQEAQAKETKLNTSIQTLTARNAELEKAFKQVLEQKELLEKTAIVTSGTIDPADKNATQALIDTLKKQNKELSRRLTVAIEQNLELSGKVQDLSNAQSENTASAKMLKEFEAKLAKSAKELASNQIQLKQAEATAMQLQEENEKMRVTLTARFDKNPVDIAKEEVSKQYKKLNAQWDRERETLTKQLERQKALMETYKNSLSSMQQRFAILKESSGQAQKENEESQSNLGLMKNTIDRLSRENTSLREITSKYDVEALARENKMFKVLMEKADSLNTMLKKRVTDLEEIKIKPDVDLFLKRLNRKNKAIDDLIKELEVTKSDNEQLTVQFEDMERQLLKRNERLLQYKKLLDEKKRNFAKLADIKNRLEDELRKMMK